MQVLNTLRLHPGNPYTLYKKTSEHLRNSPPQGMLLNDREEYWTKCIAKELINEDPYQKGWLLKVKPSKLAIDKKNLLSGSLAKAWLENRVNSLSVKISDNYGVVLQDGGTIKNGFAKDMSPDKWDLLAKEYFQSSELN